MLLLACGVSLLFGSEVFLAWRFLFSTGAQVFAGDVQQGKRWRSTCNICTSNHETISNDSSGHCWTPSEEESLYSDIATQAILLRRITTADVLEAMKPYFSMFGWPKELLSDRGTNFTSNCSEELNVQLFPGIPSLSAKKISHF